jgi:hypothetical protein
MPFYEQNAAEDMIRDILCGRSGPGKADFVESAAAHMMQSV